jgi:hypothetical protein
MTTRIREVYVVERSLSPVQAELWVRVATEGDGDVEVRGRLTGPRCLYSETIEVAYPLRPHPMPEQPDTTYLRVIIPEPSFWEPETPFLYHGSVELYQGGEGVDALAIRCGLRSVQRKGAELQVNGRSFPLRVKKVEAVTRAEAESLRREGYNLLALSREDAEVFSVADEIGLFIVTRGKPSRPGFCHPSDLRPLFNVDEDFTS